MEAKTGKIRAGRLAAILIVVMSLSPLLYSGAKSALNRSGMCVPEFRYLTETEKLESGLRRAYFLYPMYGLPAAGDEAGRIRKNAIGFRTFEDFAAAQKGCCTISKSGGSTGLRTWFGRMTGAQTSYIDMTIKIFYRDGNGAVRTVMSSKDNWKIPNCGFFAKFEDNPNLHPRPVLARER